jgi:hypothetical protein
MKGQVKGQRLKPKGKPENLHLKPFAFPLTFHPFTFDLWGSYADR